MARPKVYVFIPSDREGLSHKNLEHAGCELLLGDPTWRAQRGATVETFQAKGKGAVALLGARIEGLTLDRAALSVFSDLRILARYNIGYDDINLDDCTAMGIAVTHAPVESNWGGVAEGAFAMMLTMLKRLPELDRHVRNGGWRTGELNGTFIGRRQDGYAGIRMELAPDPLGFTLEAGWGKRGGATKLALRAPSSLVRNLVFLAIQVGLLHLSR